VPNRRTRFRPIYLVHAVRWLIGAIAFLATAAAISGFAFPGWDLGIRVWGAWIPSGWAFAAVALVAWVAYRFVMRPLVVWNNDVATWVPLDDSAGDPAVDPQFELELRSWSTFLGEDRLRILADLLLTPRQRIRRITEVVRYVGRAVEISMSVIFERPTGPSKSIVVPVIMREKGNPNDVLTLHDDQGHRTAQLSTLDTSAICTVVVERLIESALRQASKRTQSGKASVPSHVVSRSLGRRRAR